MAIQHPVAVRLTWKPTLLGMGYEVWACVYGAVLIALALIGVTWWQASREAERKQQDLYATNSNDTLANRARRALVEKLDLALKQQGLCEKTCGVNTYNRDGLRLLKRGNATLSLEFVAMGLGPNRDDRMIEVMARANPEAMKDDGLSVFLYGAPIQVGYPAEYVSQCRTNRPPATSFERNFYVCSDSKDGRFIWVRSTKDWENYINPHFLPNMGKR